MHVKGTLTLLSSCRIRQSDKSIIAELYPDKATFEREEKRRFELLIEHTGVPAYLEAIKEWNAPAPAG